MEKDKTIFFFDGVCGLCNRCVSFLLKADKKHRFYFAALQGKTAQAMLDSSLASELETVVLYHQGQFYTQSTAILKAFLMLGGGYLIFSLGFIIPKIFRDKAYQYIARRRYTWFGQKQSCRLPTLSERKFFLD